MCQIRRTGWSTNSASRVGYRPAADEAAPQTDLEETAVDDSLTQDNEYELVEYELVPFWLGGLRLDVSPNELQAALRKRMHEDRDLRCELERDEPEVIGAIYNASQDDFACFIDAVLDRCPVKSVEDVLQSLADDLADDAPAADTERTAGLLSWITFSDET